MGWLFILALLTGENACCGASNQTRGIEGLCQCSDGLQDRVISPHLFSDLEEIPNSGVASVSNEILMPGADRSEGSHN